MDEKERIIVIDDEEDVRALLKAMLEIEFDVDLAADGNQALELFKSHKYIAAVIDIALPGPYNGFELISEIRNISYDTRIILITGLALDPEVRKRTEQADAFIMKPFSIEEIVNIIHETLTKARS